MITELLDTIQQQDCIEGMQQLPNASLDLVIADPPYNLSKGNNWEWDNSVALPGFGGNWNKVMEEWDDMPLADYWKFTLAWLTEAKRLLKPTGSLWVFGTYHNIGLINVSFQLLNIEIINEIIWYKRNAFPNLAARRFTASHETLLWGHTGGKQRKYCFNYELVKELPCPEDSLKKAGKQMRTVWDISNNKSSDELKYGTIPTQKPLRICERLILATSNIGDVILVPFAGSGSECIAARQLGRHYIGFETNSDHLELAEKRLNDIRKEAPLFSSAD